MVRIAYADFIDTSYEPRPSDLVCTFSLESLGERWI